MDMAELVTTTSAPVDVGRLMALEGLCAEAREPLRYGGSLQVRAGNLVAEIQQNFGDAAHADAADAYEMDALNLGEHCFRDCNTSFPAGLRGCTLMIKHFTADTPRTPRKAFTTEDTEPHEESDSFSSVLLCALVGEAFSWVGQGF